MLLAAAPQTAAPLHPRQNLLLVGGFRDGLPCAQEYDLHIRLAILCKIKFITIDHVGVLIRPITTSVSRAAGGKMRLAIIDVLLNAYELLEHNGMASSENKSAIAQQLSGIARALWREGNVNEARSLVKRAKSLSNEWFIGCYNGSVATFLASTLGFSAFECLHSLYTALWNRR